MLLGIKRVLDMTPADEIELSQGGGVVVQGPSFGAGVALDGWADGYRLTFLWRLDLYGNRRLRDRPTWAERVAGQPAGKLDSFPLVSEKTRAMGPNDDVNKEQRLLLDPTRDDPELHLTFDVKGRAVAAQGSRMGKTSIGVYHLNRKRLRSQREVRIRLVLDQIHDLTEAGLAHGTALRLVTASLGKSKQAYAGTARAISRDPIAFGLVATD